MDPAALAEYEAAHLGIPAARLVAEVDAGLQQLPDADFGGQRVAPLRGVDVCPPAGSRTRDASRAGPRPLWSSGVACFTAYEHSRRGASSAGRAGRSGKSAPRTRRGGPETASLVCLSPRLALRRLAPVGRCQVHDEARRVVWTRKPAIPP